jgi:hypothetical protein
MRRTDEHVLYRVDALRAQNADFANDKQRIRQIMNGGVSGIAAIMAWDQGKGSSGKMDSSVLGSDLPAANMMASGVERLAQKVGVVPTLKMPYGNRDSDTARKKAEKRERIVEGWDHLSNVRMQFPQVGRWLPGYAFVAWVIRPRKDKVTGQLWPHLELRDPFDTWPGFFGAEQQPHEIGFRRSVPIETLKYIYPDIPWGNYSGRRMAKTTQYQGRGTPGPVGGNVDSSWEGSGGGTQIVEYMDDTGSYVCAPEFEAVIDHIPNILTTGPMFHVAKRFSFDRPVGQYHHIIGLVAMMAKMNMLALISSEDSTFKETNIFGDLEGNTYERGRFAINFFEPGTKVEKPTGDNNTQLFQQIDRLERQLRIGAAYDQGSDSLAARGGFITGRGQQELRDPIDANIGEYQRIISHSMETLDTRRLEWEERHEQEKRKRVFYIDGSKQGEETYVPNDDIGGSWRSRRVYGMMATWDDNSKIVAGLQLLQGGIIDTLTMQENLDGLDDVAKINQRINQDRAKADLFAALEQMAAQGDPRAAMVLVQIMDKPDQTVKILKKFFTPQEPQMSPEEQAMAQAGAGGEGGAGGELALGPPSNVQSVLSELEASGVTGGGVQTVQTTRR